MTNPTTVRFWTYHTDGYVRLTLREGQSLHWHTWGQTDEGYSARWEVWTLEDGVVTNESGTDGRDCDGRFSTENTCICQVTDLAAYVTPDGVGVPAYTRKHSGQRDYSAEAMGY